MKLETEGQFRAAAPKSSNPDHIIASLVERHPDRSRDHIERLFISKVDDDPALLQLFISYYFGHAWARLKRSLLVPARTEEISRQVAEMEIKLRRSVILSEMIMHNGKKLAECTGIEATKFGGFYAKVGQIAKRRKIGTVMTEAQLWDLWQRHKA